MIDSRARLLAAALVGVLGLGIACTQSYLYDERRRDELPIDRTVTLEGRFCTLGANDVVRPIKILFAFDASQSMRVSDPNGTRALAVIQLLNSLPRDPNIDFSVMLFAGSTTANLTKSGLAEFEPLSQLHPGRLHRADRQDPQLHQPQHQSRLHRLREGAVGDLRDAQHRHHRQPQRGGGRPGRCPATVHRHLPLRRTPHLQPGRRALPGRRGEADPPAADPGRRRDLQHRPRLRAGAAGVQHLRRHRRRRLSAADHQPGR